MRKLYMTNYFSQNIIYKFLSTKLEQMYNKIGLTNNP